jgi:hypothetical protein
MVETIEMKMVTKSSGTLQEFPWKVASASPTRMPLYPKSPVDQQRYDLKKKRRRRGGTGEEEGEDDESTSADQSTVKAERMRKGVAAHQPDDAIDGDTGRLKEKGYNDE